MLTIIPNPNLDELESLYPSLKDYERNYILYQNEKFSYLPRYFPKQFPYDGYILYNDPNFSEQNIEIELLKPPRDYQVDALDFMVNHYNNNGFLSGIFEARVAFGKCHGKGTEIIMYDGSLKKVEDIKIGDLVMGPDNNPRTVFNIGAGFGKLFKVTPVRGGDPFICNEDHVLSLKWSGNHHAPHHSILNISLKDYQNNISNGKKRDLKLWRAPKLDFSPTQSLEYDPYIIGLYIADGTRAHCAFTIHNNDIEILQYLYKWVSEQKYTWRMDYNSENSNNYHITGVNQTFFKFIKDQTIVNNEKRIPNHYLMASRHERLELLAGILDGDGCLDNTSRTCFQIFTKFKGLSEDIAFLARSLGFGVSYGYIKREIKSLNFIGYYHRISIFGDTFEIPTKLPRKQAEFRTQNNSVHVSAFKIEYIEDGDFYGFELDGDHLYLLKDFTVCHNTYCSAYLTATLKKKTLIVLDNSKLMQQWIDAYLDYTNLTEEDIGIIKGNRMDLDKPVCIAMVQTMMSKVKRDLKQYYTIFRDAGFGLVVYDEVHKTSSGPRYATSTLLLNTKNILGLSATPFAHDLHKVLLYNSIGDIIYVAKDYQVKPKHVYFIKYDSGLKDKYYKKFKFLRDYIKSIAFYNSIIAENEFYLKVIFALTQQCVKVNHKVLIMVNTIQQVETIIKYLNDRHIQATPVYSKANEIVKGVDNVLVGTMKFASTGFDYSELSALILATPLKGKTSLIQSIGRIVRAHPGKNPPVVMDLIDQSFPHIFENNIGIKTKVISDEFKIELDAFKTIQFNIKPDNPDDDDI